MGIFDYVKCEVPLPGDPKPPHGTVFQSKDMSDPYMETYTITADGKLTRTDAFGDVVLEQFHGDLRFTEFNGKSDEWWEYKARFTDGELSKIELLEYSKYLPSNT